MLEIFKKNITFDKLLQDEKTIALKQLSSDFVSYPEFIKYFNDIVIISKHNLVIGINFTYAWMPTMFDFRSDNFEEVIKILNSAKQGQIPTENELEILKKCFNNSLVGASKLLHFINPSQFAIWDSRVYRYLTNEEPHSYRLDKYKSYFAFLDFCNFITNHDDYLKIHNSVIEKVGYQMTKIRTAELIMYIKGEQPKTIK